MFKISAENPVGNKSLIDFSFLLPVAKILSETALFESSNLFTLNAAPDINFNLYISRSNISKWKISLI